MDIESRGESMKNKIKKVSIFVLIFSISLVMFSSYNTFKNDNVVEEDSTELIGALDSSSTNLTVMYSTGLKIRRTSSIGSNINDYYEASDGSIYKYACKKGLLTTKTCSVSLSYTITDSNYQFVGWSNDCSSGSYLSNNTTYTVSFTNKDSKLVKACTKKKSSTTTTTTKKVTTTTTKKTTTTTKKTTTTTASSKQISFYSTDGTFFSGYSKGENPNNITVHYGLSSKYVFSCSSVSSNCGVSVTASVDSGYTFTGWTQTNNCNDIFSTNKTLYRSFNASSSATYKACAKKTTTVTSTNVDLSVGVQNSNVTLGSYAKVSNSSNIDVLNNTSSSQKFACNKSGITCKVKLTAQVASGYKFDGWSTDGCSTIKYYDLSVEVPFTYGTTSRYTACASVYSSSGTTTTTMTNKVTTTTKPTVTEAVVKDAFTSSYNNYVYAKGNEYQGSSINCGDKLYISSCTTDSDPICKVTSINGKSVSNTQIRKSNFTSNESDTGCFNEITRYIKEKTYYFSDSSLSQGKTEIGCGSTVVFKESIDSACSAGSCKVYYNDKLVYISSDKIVSDKPVCSTSNSNICTTSSNVTDLKGTTSVKICSSDDNENKRNSIVSCAEDYEKSYKLINDTCNGDSDCYKEYKYTCTYVKRPGISASAGALKSNGYGTLTITGIDNGSIGLKGYYISNGTAPTENSSWVSFGSNNSASVDRTAGTYFIWSMNNKNRISNQIMAKVYDSELSTTLSSVSITDGDGNDVSLSSLDNSIGYNGEIIDGKYALLSNSLIADTKIGGFDKLTTAYEISVSSNKVAIYTTLTSSDASYVSGYEPRTIDLDYGRNVALIKIVNKSGRERTYTFIVNRVDDRSNSNILNDITLSKGNIEFDPYTTNYTVKIPKSTKVVSVNAELNSQTASFIKYYEPREVQISEDVQSVVLKVMSEAGSIRSYVITFVKSDIKDDSKNSSYLSSLTVPGTQLGFDRETYDYTITVPYDTESIPIYAFAESEKAEVTIGNNTGLKVGNNLIEIEVKNGSNIKVYNLHVIRKESGLDIANSARLGLLSIKNYNIDFNPDNLDYTVKIKREKSLLITASPESNRADIYMYGNNDLTGFSTVRVKVIAENGLTNIYSIDIQKAAYNKKIEIIAAACGGLIVLGSTIIIVIRNRRKKMKEYLEG